MKKYIIIAAILLAGCTPEADTQMGTAKNVAPETHAPSKNSPRISITRIAIVNDDLAYGNRRGVYVITDAFTGKEYIGVSGIGISEIGSHQSGKSSIGDER